VGLHDQTHEEDEEHLFVFHQYEEVVVVYEDWEAFEMDRVLVNVIFYALHRRQVLVKY